MASISRDRRELAFAADWKMNSRAASGRCTVWAFVICLRRSREWGGGNRPLAPKSGRKEIFLGQMFGKTPGKSEMNKTEEGEEQHGGGSGE